MSKKVYFLISFVLVLGLASNASAELKFSYRCSWWSDLGSGHDWNEPNNWWTMDRYYDDTDGDDEEDTTEEKVYVKVDPNQVPDGNIVAYIGKGDAHINYPQVLHDLVEGSYVMTDPTISSGTVEANDVFCGGGYSLVDNISGSTIDGDYNTWDPCAYHELTITGGTLTIGTPQTWEGYDTETWYSGDWWGKWGPGRLLVGVVGWRTSGLGARPVPFGGTMNMNGGTVNVGGHMEVSAWEEAVGKLNMNGGVINITQGLYCPASWWGATGYINLNGGTINARYFTMIDDGYGANTGVIDVNGGTLMLERDEEEKINNYASGGVTGMSVTVHGVSHGGITGGKRAALSIDYDVSNEGKTTVQAFLTDPNQAWAPSPPTGALNVKGPPANLKRPILSWSPGDNATSHDVYFGSTFAKVNDATTSSAECKQTAYDPCNWTVNKDLKVFETYYWRIDERPGPTKGEVWNFRIGDLAKSSYPYPQDGATGVSAFVELHWTPGIYATSHDVYFSTDFNDVNDRDVGAKTNVGPNSLTPGPLELDTTYYWAVDEVNSGAIPWPGDIWSFTTTDHHTVDDFDGYNNNPALYAVWDDYWVNGSGAQIFIEGTVIYTADGNSIRYSYNNTTKVGGKYVGSRINADIVDLPIGQDWTASGVKGLTLYFYGDALNAPTSNDKMYVALYDGSKTGVVKYPDVNDVKEPEWHEWNIELQDFADLGVVLSSIDRVYIGFGGYAWTGQAAIGSKGKVYFDEVGLWRPRCVSSLTYPYGDLTGDCTIDGYDLEVMTDDWLVTDYNSLGYTGDLKGFPGQGDANYDNCWVTGKVGSNSLYFNLDDPDPCDPYDQGDDYVKIPPLNLNSNTVTFTCWAKRHGLQRDDSGLFFCSYLDDGPPDNTQSGFVVGLGTNNALGYNWENSSKTWGFRPAISVLPNDAWAFCALAVAPGYADIYIMKESTGTIESDRNITTHAAEEFDCPSRIGDHKERRFVGAIDDFRIYDYTLSSSEIEYLAKLGASGTAPDANHLYAHYKLDDGTGLVALDSAGVAVNWWPVPSTANLVDPEAEGERSVNFRDYAILADNWLQEYLWPFE
jgi:hypothetical protein